MSEIVMNASMFQQLLCLTFILIILIIIKFIRIGYKKPKNQDFISSIVICVSIYSTWAILKVVSTLGESNDIVIPMFFALAMQLWMTFNSFCDYYSKDRNDDNE